MTPLAVPPPNIETLSDDEILGRAQHFFERMQRRRTIRDFFRIGP